VFPGFGQGFFENKSMNAKDLAAQLNGIQYPVRIPKTLTDAAKAAGLVIVYGASDDLMEFEGAIYDEVGVYDGGVAHVDAKGLLLDRDSIDDDEDLKDYFVRQPFAKQTFRTKRLRCWRMASRLTAAALCSRWLTSSESAQRAKQSNK
jgi:hypothetical protein